MAREEAIATEWTDPGYFKGRSAWRNSLRLMVQLIRPPRGHRTLPTKTGFLYIVVTIGVGTAGFNTGQNILYLVLALLLSALLVSGILSWLNFKGCRWRLESGKVFRAGSASPVYLKLRNSKRWLPSFSLEFLIQAGEQQQVLVLRRPLKAGDETRMEWDFIPARRGRQTLMLDRMVTAYPFGFLRKSIRESVGRAITVWPARIQYDFRIARGGNRWLYGQHRRRGEGVDLLQLRPYRDGDPLRSVHWKATARMRTLYVRETEQEHHQAFALWLDVSESLWSAEAFERLCSFVGSLAEDLFAHDQLRMVQIAGEPPIMIRDQHALHLVMDRLGELECHPLPANSEFRTPPQGAVQFAPDGKERVVATLDGEVVGHA